MKALVLSGGGTHGAYQVGVLKRLLVDEENHYDIVAGVSVGAINAAGIAQFKKGQELLCHKYLDDLWRTVDNSTVWKHHFPPYMAALWKPGLYSTEPLRKFLTQHMDTDKILESGKKLRVAAVSLTSGAWKVWNEDDKDLLEGVMASSAFPGMFDAITVGDEQYTDGGVRTVTPLKDAIDAGATEVDVILTEYPEFDIVPNNLKTLKVLLRSLNIMMNEVVENDLKVCALKNNVEGYRKIKLRVFRPSERLSGPSLDFDPKNIRYELGLGYRDVRNYDKKER